MSRDFKQEYENYISKQTPDLWARIETGLAEKEVSVTPATKKKKIPTRFWTYGLTAAAAVLICIVAIPMLSGGLLRGEMESAMDAGTAEMAADFSLNRVTSDRDNTANCEVAGATRQEVAEEGAVPRENAAPQVEAEEEAAEIVGTPSADSVAATEKMSADTLRVEVKVVELSEMDGRTVYKVMLKGESVLLVFSGDFSEEAELFKGETYLVLLEEAQETAPWDYVIVSMGIE
ncbi:MAG: hypothetical protein IJ282_05705 [Lachnospiraceae bacterium]|nr:hypothetical protein [Lachnospiraceae bacterium]